MTSDQTAPTILPLALPSLTVLRARVTLRMLQDSVLPAAKGALLRGGFGYAFQSEACPRACWGQSEGCAASAICPFRWVFATPHPPDVSHFHDLRDLPRPFVICPPDDDKRSYAAGETLEFSLIVIGRGIDYLPYFFRGFERFAATGLGQDRARARLERIEALEPFQAVGRPIYQDGRALTGGALPVINLADLALRAALPPDLRITFATPLRVKAGGSFIETVDLPAISTAIGWRLSALATFHGDGPWRYNYRPLAQQAAAVAVERPAVQWRDWERTSGRTYAGAPPKKMNLGGIVGQATLRAVPPDLRLLLLAGSLVHVGKACVFGNGACRLEPASPSTRLLS